MAPAQKGPVSEPIQIWHETNALKKLWFLYSAVYLFRLYMYLTFAQTTQKKDRELKIHPHDPLEA